jgi:hypothetical protein
LTNGSRRFIFIWSEHRSCCIIKKEKITEMSLTQEMSYKQEDMIARMDKVPQLAP